MRRRFQFSLRVIFAAVAVVAAACAIWIRLPIDVRLAIGAGTMGLFWWLITPRIDLGLSDLLPRIARGRSPQTHIIKRKGERSSQTEFKGES